MFQLTWPSVANTQYIQNTWEDISNRKLYCMKMARFANTTYWLLSSINSKYGLKCRMFQLTWPSVANTQYIQNTWKDISNIKLYCMKMARFANTSYWILSSINSKYGLKCRMFQLTCPSLANTQYTGCPRRKGPNFGRVFLRSNYNDITQNTYI